MHDLKLAADLSGWRLYLRRKHDKRFLPVKRKILTRDAFTCQYCGFQAKEYQDVVNADGDYRNNKFGNMITACCFCSQCLFIQAAGMDDMGGGQLIFLPEISQGELNSFCHVLFCAMGNSTGYQDSATAIYRSLKFRSQQVENKFGPGTSNPSVLGQLIIEHKDKNPETEIDILKDIRLLPSNTKFRVQLDAWAASALKELSADDTELQVGND